MRDSRRRIVVSRCIGKTVEREAIAARKAVGDGGRRGIMSVSDMRNRVDRERQ